MSAPQTRSSSSWLICALFSKTALISILLPIAANYSLLPKRHVQFMFSWETCVCLYVCERVFMRHKNPFAKCYCVCVVPRFQDFWLSVHISGVQSVCSSETLKRVRTILSSGRLCTVRQRDTFQQWRNL